MSLVAVPIDTEGLVCWLGMDITAFTMIKHKVTAFSVGFAEMKTELCPTCTQVFNETEQNLEISLSWPPSLQNWFGSYGWEVFAGR